MTFMSRVRRPIVLGALALSLVLACEDDPDPLPVDASATPDAPGPSPDLDRGIGDPDGSTLPGADAGPCPAGEFPDYDAPGCGMAAKFVCRKPTMDACAALISYCGCDGKTFIGGCTSAGAPYVHKWACADAGAAEVGGGDGGTCTQGAPRYQSPGCGAAAQVSCVSSGLDAACVSYYCTCDDRTVSSGCGASEVPYKHVGPCADAGQ